MYYELANESFMLENDHYNQALMDSGTSVEILGRQTNFRNASSHACGAEVIQMNQSNNVSKSSGTTKYDNFGLTLKERGYKKFDHKLQPML